MSLHGKQHRQIQNKNSTNGALRWQKRNQIVIQRRTPLRVGNKNALFMVNLYHQDQASNIELFELTDTAIELGIRIAL